MIKVLNQYFPGRWAVVLIGESLLILLALMAAEAWESRAWTAPPPLGLLLKAGMIVLICQLCLHYSDLYEPHSRAAGGLVLTRLLRALGLASLVLALVYWLLPQVRMSTGMVIGAVIALVAILLGWRRAVDEAWRWSHRAGPGRERLLMVVAGADEGATDLVREMRRRPQLGLELAATIDAALAPAGSAREPQPCGAGGLRVLGGLDRLAEAIAAIRPSRIVIAVEDGSHRLPLEPLLSAHAAGIRIEEAHTLYERVTGKLALAGVPPTWLVLADNSRASLALRFYQHAVSRLTALLGLVLAAPLMALVAAAIRLDSAGPVIYRQERVGRNGCCFDMLKFRSMRVDAESVNAPVWAQERDPRVTRVGRWLRTLRLDEIPQLINVLRGDMNLIGPRPERPHFVAEFRRAIPSYEMRHLVRPGITGWAQVSRAYAANLDDAREKLEYDLFYIKNMSVWLDLFILFQTTKIVLLGRGAR